MGKTMGVLNLTNKKDNQPFTREDLNVLTPIASEIASILSQGIAFRKNVRTFSISILGSLTDALELRYPFLHGHSERVRSLSLLTGERMGLGEQDMEALEHAAFLHDVGIVGIPSNILSKKHGLNEREMDMVRKHPVFGAKLMEGVPEMDSTKRTILEHHENFDGSGYPYGLRGQDISITARILGVTEYYDSVVSERPHRGRLSSGTAMQMIRNSGNRLFDPEVITAFEKTVFTPEGIR
jgi:HD-GYP domain-containing protein (c-di-GMP phosphodiesterase class II)